MSPSFNPETGLLYVDTHTSYSLYYDLSNGKPEGFAGRDLSVWSHSFSDAQSITRRARSAGRTILGPGGNWAGVLSTAGGMVFTGDNHGNILGLNAQTGETLWHAYGGGAVKGPPITYELDGKQYLLVGSQEVLYSFALPEAGKPDQQQTKNISGEHKRD